MAPNDFLAFLDACVSTTEECSRSLGVSVDNLSPGTQDLPRLTKVLGNNHHFLVLPQPTVQAHKSLLSHHLAPQIDTLIAKAESGVEAQKAKIQRLEERLSIIQSARLPDPEPSLSTVVVEEEEDDGGETCRLDGLDQKSLDAAQRRKVIMLRGKRKRLEDERAALGL